MKNDDQFIEPVKISANDWQLGIINQLVELKRQGALPHAILVELRTSVDSRSFGWFLASALLCQSEDNKHPCGHCHACELMAANIYPDFTFTTLTDNEKTHKLNKDIKIEQIRRLIHQFSLTNNLQSGKIALIYPAEKLNQSSANSLLKTLEEPSAESILILLTHNSGRLPVTIRSRCQKWVVENPATNPASQWLAQQGIPTEYINDYLQLAHNDAQLAQQLYQQQFKQLQNQFSGLLARYISGQIDIVTMLKQVKFPDSQQLRLVLKTEISNMIYNLLQNKLTTALKHKLADLINLSAGLDRTLQVKDNNLNLQLQLEDVLISLKQIVK